MLGDSASFIFSSMNNINNVAKLLHSLLDRLGEVVLPTQACEDFTNAAHRHKDVVRALTLETDRDGLLVHNFPISC